MTPARRKKKRDQLKITVESFRNLSDYKACLDIQREVWSYSDIDIVPVTMLLSLNQYGGMLLGAYNSLGEMIGFVCSALGMEKGEVLHHSHMLAVRPAYQNFDVGYRLKLAQRKEVMKRKVRSVAWAFDPMQPMNAYFNLGKLAARAGAYKENYYGETTSSFDRGAPTDRLFARWDLKDKGVEERLNSGPQRHDLRKDLKKYPVINHLEEVAPGMTRSSPVKLNFLADEFLFEIPYNLPDVKNRDLGVALEWQGRMRQVFRACFRKGYEASDFWVAEDDGHLRAFYFMRRKKK